MSAPDSLIMHSCGNDALQALIGGGDHQGLDLEDMKQHVNYAGGYEANHPVILEFWRVRGRCQSLSTLHGHQAGQLH